MQKTSFIGTLFLVLCSLAKAQKVGSEINKHINITDSGVILNNTDFSIACVSCYVIGDFSLAAGLGDTLPDANFSNLPLNFNDTWAAAVVEDFTIHVEVEVSLTPQNLTNEISIPLLGEKGLTIPWNIGIITIDWVFDPILHGWVNASKPVNFRYGFELDVPRDSAAYVGVLGEDKVAAGSMGFNETTLTPLNYTSSDPSDAFGFELSFRPIFQVHISVLEIFDAPLQATVFADVPKLDIIVDQVANATSDCKPAAAGTPPDQVYNNLTLVTPTLGFDFGWNATLLVDIPGDVYQIGHNISLPTSCLEYDAQESMLVRARESKTNAGSRLIGTLPLAWLSTAVLSLSFLL